MPTPELWYRSLHPEANPARSTDPRDTPEVRARFERYHRGALELNDLRVTGTFRTLRVAERDVLCLGARLRCRRHGAYELRPRGGYPFATAKS